jgi:hypothetical protein
MWKSSMMFRDTLTLVRYRKALGHYLRPAIPDGLRLAPLADPDTAWARFEYTQLGIEPYRRVCAKFRRSEAKWAMRMTLRSFQGARNLMRAFVSRRMKDNLSPNVERFLTDIADRSRNANANDLVQLVDETFMCMISSQSRVNSITVPLICVLRCIPGGTELVRAEIEKSIRMLINVSSLCWEFEHCKRVIQKVEDLCPQLSDVMDNARVRLRFATTAKKLKSIEHSVRLAFANYRYPDASQLRSRAFDLLNVEFYTSTAAGDVKFWEHHIGLIINSVGTQAIRAVVRIVIASLKMGNIAVWGFCEHASALGFR